MIEFKPITLDNLAWAKEILAAENCPSADYNFTNIYCWQDSYRTSLARVGDRVLVKIDYFSDPIFAYPVGRGPLRPAVEALHEYINALGKPFVMRGITEELRVKLENEFPGCFEYTEEENSFDYIYLAEKLATYSGKALHAKKNHCNRFEAENDWRFVPLTKELIPDCRAMLETWKQDNAERLDDSVKYEYTVIDRALNAFDELGLEGGVLYSGDKIVGFTYGDFTTEDTLDTHVEKADARLNGAYPMVCREFVRMMMAKHPNLRYVNREDDMGLEYLRHSKMSYKPERLLRKFRARWIDG